MILIVNCIANADERAGFNRRIVPRLAEIAGSRTRVLDLERVADVAPDAAWTHVLLSGSELSAARRYPTDDPLLAFIHRVVRGGLPLLGICYGHQMIARALVGDDACRRATVPEFGFKTLQLVDNPLFEGIETLTPVHSHYDEVTGLPSERFEIIASTADCAVQALQVRQHPVWGVQFHPELDERAGRKMLARNLKSEPAAREHFVDELTDPDQINACRRLFGNFFRADSR
jgi:GMP synthase (glutamine-hydrolysing)